VVNFTPRPLYPRYPLYRRLGGRQSRSGRHGEVIIPEWISYNKEVPGMRSCELDVSGLMIQVLVCEYGFEVLRALIVKRPGFLLLRTDPDFSEEI
jgi:hypothetical protein